MSEDWSDGALRDFRGLLLGDRLGSGMSRSVFVLATDSTKVIKFEQPSRSFQNVIEWETWDRMRGTEHAKWLAPCHSISPCGMFLIMDRTEPLRKREIPQLLPEWLSDHKLANYGLIGKQVVCHDYGTNLLLYNGASKRMRKTFFGEE